MTRLGAFKSAMLAYAATVLPEVSHAELARSLDEMEVGWDDTFTFDYQLQLPCTDPSAGVSHVAMVLSARAMVAGGPEWMAAMAVGQVRTALDLRRGNTTKSDFLAAPGRAAALADECGRLRDRLALAEKRIGELELGILATRLA